METENKNDSLLNQEEYECNLNRARNIILNVLDLLETEIEKRTEDEYIPCLEALLSTLLLVSDTQKGEKLFIRVLEYVKYKRPLLANKYWELFDDRDDLFKKRYYNININS